MGGILDQGDTVHCGQLPDGAISTAAPAKWTGTISLVRSVDEGLDGLGGNHQGLTVDIGKDRSGAGQGDQVDSGDPGHAMG